MQRGSACDLLCSWARHQFLAVQLFWTKASSAILPFPFSDFDASALSGHMGPVETLRSNPRHRSPKRGKRRVEVWEDLDLHDQLTVWAIGLSVAITFLEACYISNGSVRLLSNLAQAVFAITFCSLQGYGFYLYAQERNSSYSESLRQFFFVDLEDTDANWNMCDLALNAVSILDMFLDTFEGRFVHALAAVRVVRIVRLVRIVSLVPLLGPSKFVEDFSRVSHMAVEQMFNFLVVILASLLVLSVCATNMLWDFPDAEVAACYGNLGATMWTLFKIMTMDGWIDRVETVMVVHPNMLYFYAVFVFLSLSSVSIVPAIFIDILLEDLLKTRDEVRREEKRRKRARRAARRGVKGNYQKYHSSEALLSDSVHQSAESQPKAAWQDDISCHSDSSLSSGSSDADLAVETKAKEAPRSFTSGQRQSQSYHLVSSGPQDHELPLRDHAFQELLDDALESVSRCGELAQLSSELQLIQSGLEAHLQGLLKKLTAGVGSEPSARWPEQGSVKKVSVCTPSETPTLRLPPGRPAGSAYGSAPPGDREGPPRPTAVILERSSCLGQRMDPEDGLSAAPI